MKNKYTAEYFIGKFEAIPEDKWTTGTFKNKHGQFCALGHCGVRNGKSVFTVEGRALQKLFNQTEFHSAVSVNDDACNEFFNLGYSPKERVINALTLIATGLLKETE